MHEDVFAGKPTSLSDEASGEDDELSEDELYVQWSLNSWKETTPETRAAVNRLLDDLGVNVVTYRTNAELSVMAAAFVDDNERNLLFRVYVPSGRLYAAEADKLLNLFRDWLNNVGRRGIRQDGYTTAAGHVYEFFGGSESLPGQTLTQQFDDFADFLGKCVDDPSAAEDGLVLQCGMDRRTAPGIVQRYGKEARRLNIDLRQEREARMLALRHRFESELLDSAEVEDGVRYIGELIEKLVPRPPGFNAQALLLPSAPATPVTINVNQQFIKAAEGTIVHNVQGTAHFGVETKELLALIERFTGQDTADSASGSMRLDKFGE